MLNFCSLKLHHVRSLKKMLACFALKLFPFLLLCDSDPPHSLCSFVILQAAWLFQPLFPSFCQQVIIPLNFASKGITLTSSWKSCFLWQNSGCLNFLFKDPRSAFVPWVPYSLCWTSSPLVFYQHKGSYRSNTVCSCFQSCQFPRQACAGTCMHPYRWLWLCALYCLLLRRVEYFKPRMSRHKYKSSRDVAGAAKKCQVMMMETKVNRFKGVQWQEEEEISEELKRFTKHEKARRLSLSEEVLLVFESQSPNVDQYMKVDQYLNSNSCSECNTVATMSSMMRNKICCPDITRSFLEGR